MSLLAGTITFNGARTQLASNPRESIDLLILRARPTNGDDLYLGDSQVSASNGMMLRPGDVLRLEFRKEQALTLSDFYLYGDANGDGLDFLAVAR